MRTLLVALALLSACSPESSRDFATADGVFGGKADAPAPLVSTSLTELVTCRAVIDPSTGFAAADRLRCTMPALGGVEATSWVEVRDARPDVRSATLREGDRDRDAVVSYRDRYPLRVRVTVGLTLPGQPQSLYFGEERTFASPAALGALTAASPWRAGLPARLDEVALYPTLSLAASLDGSSSLEVRYDASLPITSSELAVTGPRPASELRITRHEIFRSASAMRAARFLALVPTSGPSPAFSLALYAETGDPSVSALVTTGPGYYLWSGVGEARLVGPADLPVETPMIDAGMPEDAAVDATAGSDADATVDADAVAADAAADAAAAPVDPCAGVCVEGEVCAAAHCVRRELQYQDYSFGRCGVPTALCEEDTDCVLGHACAGGRCRRVADCQVQDVSFGRCAPADAVCEETSDCAPGHGCVLGLCRQLDVCQWQDYSLGRCGEAVAVCAADSDCAPGHACAGGRCRRRNECQVQDYSFGRCATPTAVCEETSDCAPAHRCEEGVCKHPSC